MLGQEAGSARDGEGSPPEARRLIPDSVGGLELGTVPIPSDAGNEAGANHMTRATAKITGTTIRGTRTTRSLGLMGLPLCFPAWSHSAPPRFTKR